MFDVVLRLFEVVLSVVLRLFEDVLRLYRVLLWLGCFEWGFEVVLCVLRLFEGCFEVVSSVALRVVLSVFEVV